MVVFYWLTQTVRETQLNVFVHQENEEGEIVNISSEENLFENIFRKKPVVPLTVKDNLDLLVATKSLKEVEDHIEHKERKSPLIFKRWLKRSKLSDTTIM